MVASPNGKMQRVLQISMALTTAYIAATFYFGVRAHSLALISEAGHNFSDLLAILLSFVAVYFQTRPATAQKTFGYQRAGVLAAFVNAVTLVVLSAWIALEAIGRLRHPVAVQPQLMMLVALAGVLMNGTIATLPDGAQVVGKAFQAKMEPVYTEFKPKYPELFNMIMAQQ